KHQTYWILCVAKSQCCGYGLAFDQPGSRAFPMAAIRLGLIGDHIARSQSPRLHVLAGRLCDLDVTYDRLIPADMGMDFDAVFDRCAHEGYRGINVTYPYKETVVARLEVPDPLTAAIGACNTVLFGGERPQGHNTDFS